MLQKSLGSYGDTKGFCTQLLLSGSHWSIEKYMTSRPVDFKNNGIMLSFFCVQRHASEDYRRMRRLIKGK